MERKEVFFAGLILSSLVLAFLVAVLAGNNSVYAQTTPEDVLGFNPEDLPQSPEQLASAGGQYLSGEWTKFIENNAFLNGIHTSLLSNQWVFVFLFNERYNLSAVFFWTVVFWIFFMALSMDIMQSLGLKQAILNILAGAGISVILAKVGFLGWIVNVSIKLVTANELWWVRLLLSLFLIALLILINSYFDMIKKFIVKLRREYWLKSIGKSAKAAKKLSDIQRKRMEYYEDKLEEFESRFEEQQDKIDDLRELVDEITALSDKWRKIAEESGAAAAAAEDRLEEFEEKISALKDEEQSEEIIAEIDSTKKEAELAREEVEAANERVEEAHEKILELEDAINDRDFDSFEEFLSEAKVRKSNISEYEKKLKEMVDQEQELLNARLGRK